MPVVAVVGMTFVLIGLFMMVGAIASDKMNHPEKVLVRGFSMMVLGIVIGLFGLVRWIG